jgi:hypothetical protein
MADTVWIVTKPSGISTLGDILFSVDGPGLHRQFLGGLDGSEIAGFFVDQVEAQTMAEELLGSQGMAPKAGSRFAGKLAAEQKKRTWEIKNAPPTQVTAPKGKLPPEMQREQDEMDSRFKHLLEKEEARRRR